MLMTSKSSKSDSVSSGRYAVVAAEFNRVHCERLVEGSLAGFAAKEVEENLVDVFWVPGSYEIPLAAKRLAETGSYVGLVAVGVLVKGETMHFEYIAENACRALTDIGLSADLPIGLAIIPALNLSQVEERACSVEDLGLGGKGENRGYDAALAVLQMASFRV